MMSSKVYEQRGEAPQGLAAVVIAVLIAGIERGIFRSMDVDIVSTVVAGIPQHVGLQLFMLNQAVDIPRVAEAITDYLIYGLATRN